MPFERPSLQALTDQIRNDLQSRLGQDDPLRRSDAEAYARVLSGAVHGLYGYIAYIALQILPDTADIDQLLRWCSLYKIDRKQAAVAVGTATFVTTVGAVIPLGTTIKALDGEEYETIVDGIATTTSLTLAIQAVTSGAAGNRLAGQPMTLVSPLAGVNSTATGSELSAGADIEDIESLRARLIARIQQPPHGGDAEDYVSWALEVPGVTRAWVYPLEMGPGSVSLRFVRDDDFTPIPDSTEVAAVQAYIDSVRPVTAKVYVVAPVAQPVNFSIQLSPNTSDIRASVTAAIQDFIRREAVPGGTLFLSRLDEAISSAVGENHHVMSVPSTDVTSTTNQLAQLGTITWL